MLVSFVQIVSESIFIKQKLEENGLEPIFKLKKK